MSKLPEFNQESLTDKFFHRFIAHSLQKLLVQVSILGHRQEQAAASTIYRVPTNKQSLAKLKRFDVEPRAKSLSVLPQIALKKKFPQNRLCRNHKNRS